MVWDRGRFDELCQGIEACARGVRPSSGTPFFLYAYDPIEERRCIEHMRKLASSLKPLGFEANVVWMGRLMSQVLQARGYTATQLRLLEGEDRELLLSSEEGLSRPQGGLADDLADALLSGKHGVRAMEGGSPKDVTFLLRTGALYPFVHVSEILSRLENRTRHTVAAAFPGSVDPAGEGLLRFLNEGKGRYYRATIVDGT